jgi:hypothetical protein
MASYKVQETSSQISAHPPATSVCGDVAQAEKELQTLHGRLDELEDRIYGGQPRTKSDEMAVFPDGLGALAERVRNSAYDAGERIYKILERL